MSGQKYTFDEGGVAFYYFMAAALALFVIPKTLKVAWSTWVPAKVFRAASARFVCSCDLCTERGKQKDHAAKSKNWNVWLIVGWVALFAFIALAFNNSKEEAKIFDPFEILSISSLSTTSQIRKAFKRMSLKYHPDKAQPDERQAHEKIFLDITRAYRALTDETARKNWEEYGNPDGPRTSSLGIALPSWLVDSKFNFITVLVYFALFGIGLPFLVRNIWQKSKEYTRDNILHSSMQLFYKELKEAMPIRRILDTLCVADEFKENALPAVRIEKIIEGINEHASEPYEPPKKITSSPSAASAHCLLTAHMFRVPLSKEDREEADKVILKTMRLLNGIYQISIAKKWPASTMNCMSMSALLVQALWEGSSPLLQLPYLKSDILKHCQTKRRQVKTIKDVLDMDGEERTLLFRNLSSQQIENLIEVAKHMPLILSKSAEFRMLGQDQIFPSGLVTCLVRLEHSTFGTLKESAIASSSPKSDLPKGDDADGPIAFEFDEDGNIIEGGRIRFATQDEVVARLAPVHAPYFPIDKRPGWWIMLLTKNMSHMVAPPVRVTDLIDKKTVSFQFSAPPRAGKYSFTLVIRSDCLLGVDIQRDVDLTVVPLPSAQSGESTPTEPKNHSESEASGDESGVGF